MNVPLLDIKAQISPLKNDILKAIEEVIDSSQYILGQKVKELEQQIAKYCRVKHAIGVSSGTDALLMSLMALDIKPNDIVITTPYSFFATAGVISRLGARPVFVDIEYVSYNLDPVQLRRTLETGTSGTYNQIFDVSKVKAIIPVHLYGQCAKMGEIIEIASSFNIPVIEDAAQALGAEYYLDGVKKAGTMGDMGCFSFFPSKNLGCMGDGGMVVTNNDNLAEKLSILRVHGGKPKYYHKIVGGNFRLDSIQAAILLVKLPFLNQWHKSRQRNAGIYYEKLTTDKIIFPKTLDNLEFSHIFNQFVITLYNRDELRNHLKDKGISTEIYYPVPFHLQECFGYLQYWNGCFPESERMARESLALPIYPEMSLDQLYYIIDCINNF